MTERIQTFSISKTQVRVEKVGIEAKIQSLERGIETKIYKEFDEKGFEPSGGEAQKIAIARALARKSQIVILDEPLSALDPKAEDEIFLQFNELVSGKTAVYISHRMSASQFCDQIVVFANGEVIEQGTHKQLIEKRRKYEELYHLQAKYYTSETSNLE